MVRLFEFPPIYSFLCGCVAGMFLSFAYRVWKAGLAAAEEMKRLSTEGVKTTAKVLKKDSVVVQGKHQRVETIINYSFHANNCQEESVLVEVVGRVVFDKAVASSLGDGPNYPDLKVKYLPASPEKHELVSDFSAVIHPDFSLRNAIVMISGILGLIGSAFFFIGSLKYSLITTPILSTVIAVSVNVCYPVQVAITSIQGRVTVTNQLTGVSNGYGIEPTKIEEKRETSRCDNNRRTRGIALDDKSDYARDMELALSKSVAFKQQPQHSVIAVGEWEDDYSSDEESRTNQTLHHEILRVVGTALTLRRTENADEESDSEEESVSLQ
eukprot:TRINITY_DN79250_c0_g1_i1.p1 TRINITY_DN79250_c0_g1~~TRINITY_DN79250_c0_g1_i1.p1  ORF type:complete len:345 (+),score=40.53 TRINITY_DN79250_c0_g1_i1:58-1035(+)